MKKRLSAFVFLAAVAPGVALAATPQTFGDLANLIVKLLGSATVDLIVLAIVIYFWGISSSLFGAGGEKDHSKLRDQLLWGVFVIFLAVSVWGVITLLQSTLFGSNLGGTSSSGGGKACTSLNCPFGQ